ncbi:MAG: NADH:ubiquinone oxidoreductase [Vulcanimicrobiaceae bacterium]
MSNWIGRGLRRGILTTKYPYRGDAMPERYRARPVMFPGATNEHIVRGAAACLSGAIQPTERGAVIDMQRCFQCGECARVAPEAFTFTNDFELALSGDNVETARAELRRRMEALGRSIHIRHVDCGSDASCEQELQAIFNPFYDANRLGIFLTASPRHADILIATGVVTHAMVEPLRRVYDAMPSPKVVIALGSAASSGTIFADDDVAGPVERFVPVDVKVPGTPPAPLTIIHGLWVALGYIAARHPGATS